METRALLLQSAAAEPSAEKADADPEVTEVPAPAVAAETAAPASDAAVTTTEEGAEVAAPTRTLEEVSGDAEEPDAKKAKVRTREKACYCCRYIHLHTSCRTS